MKKQIILITLGLIVVLVSISAVSAAGTVKYVNGTSTAVSPDGNSWATAYQQIDDGITDVDNGGTVNIAAGTYTGTGNIDITIGKDITIQGAGADKTIIDCQNSDKAFFTSSNNIIIKDLTIQNGNDTSGGAIYNYANLTVINCKFINNTAYSTTGGAIDSRDNFLTVIGSTFIGNTAHTVGGAIKNDWGTMTVTGCTFINNTAETMEAGAIYNSGGNSTNPTTITSCLFKSNSADSNTEGYGGAISSFQFPYQNYDGTILITGCNFDHNTAAYGGAISIYTYLETATPIKHCRFVGNTAGTSGQDIYMNGNPTLLDAKYNWWGSNSGPAEGRIAVYDTIPADIVPLYTPWLIMTIKADPTIINTGQTSTITTNVYKDSAGGDHSADASQFFSGPEVKFHSNLGTIGSYDIVVDWVLGQAVRTYHGILAGVDPITATDGQTVQTTVTVLQAPTVNAATVTEGTVGMQETGAPLAPLALAVLMVIGGLARIRRK